MTTTTPPRRLSQAELEQRWRESYPEAQGPGRDTESGAVVYGGPPDPRIGAIPKLLDDATRDRENREREARLAAMSPEQRAAIETVAALVREELRYRRG